MSLKVAVVGAGIVGLSTASELVRAGAEVRLYDKGAVAGAQSKGTTRIFRYAHADARMVALAMRAREGWRVWEDRFRRRLVGTEGLILTGDDIVQSWGNAMADAGVPGRPLGREECRERLPIGTLPDVPTLFDPAGGATRIRRTVDALRAEVASSIVSTEVQAIDASAGGCTVHATNGNWTCDEVIIVAGLDTGALARSFGLEVPLEPRLHSRFTFEIRDEYRDSVQSCLIDDSGAVGDRWFSYGQPVGSTGRYAIGVSWQGQACMLEDGEETVSRETLTVTQAYLAEALPGLLPEPVDEIRCTYLEGPLLDAHGDGFGALRRDRVTAFYGNNLFKFAPLLGELLADTAIRGTVADELQIPQTAAPHAT